MSANSLTTGKRFNNFWWKLKLRKVLFRSARILGRMMGFLEFCWKCVWAGMGHKTWNNSSPRFNTRPGISPAYSDISLIKYDIQSLGNGSVPPQHRSTKSRPIQSSFTAAAISFNFRHCFQGFFFWCSSLLILIAISSIVSLFTVWAPITLWILVIRAHNTLIQIQCQGFLLFRNNNNKPRKPWSTKSLPNPKSQGPHAATCWEAKQRLNPSAALSYPVGVMAVQAGSPGYT